MDKKKKKVLIAGVSVLVVTCLAGTGIWAAVQGGKKAVKVAPVSNMNSGGWYSESEVADYGTVTTNLNQEIYYDDSLTVKEVYVKAGDTVKVGDRLISYDTTLASLEKEMKEMQIEGIGLNIKNVQAEIDQLKNTKVVAASDVNKDQMQNQEAWQESYVAKASSENVAQTTATAKTAASAQEADTVKVVSMSAQIGQPVQVVKTAQTGKTSQPEQNESGENGSDSDTGKNEDNGNSGNTSDTENPGTGNDSQDPSTPGTPENPENPGTPSDPEQPSQPETPQDSIGTPFPEELKDKTIYEKITLESEPYNEDGDGTEEKPYRYLCAPGATVNAQFMLKVLQDQTICAFDVVDKKENPTRILYYWLLDGKTGEIVKPEDPTNPDNPEDPDNPMDPEDPEAPDFPDDSDWIDENPGMDDSDGTDGLTKEEVEKQIQEKEEQLKELDLDRRTAKLELKQLERKVDNGIVTSTVEGIVKSVNDEDTARMENQPMISVVGEEGFYVTGRIAETAYDKIKEGMTATVTSWMSGMTYEATITGVSNSPSSGYYSSNENMSYYPFTAVIKGDAELSNGEGVNLTVEGLSSVSEDELYLDQMFVREEGNQYYVYKKGENGRLTKQYVEVGKNISGTLEIIGGITFEDEIAFPYGKDVKEGAKTESVDTLYDYN